MRTCTYSNKHNVECCTECGLGVDFCQCVEPDHIAENRLTSSDGLFYIMVRDAVAASRSSDPQTTHRLASVIEGVGELAKTMGEHDRQQGTSVQEVLRNAVEVAAMAVRIAVEGDDNFLYEFPVVEDELPRGPVGGQYQ